MARVLLEPGDGPLDHVAPPVPQRIDDGGRPPLAPRRAGGLLVGPLGHGVRDPPAP
jgi:hypothetical protein